MRRIVVSTLVASVFAFAGTAAARPPAPSDEPTTAGGEEKTENAETTEESKDPQLQAARNLALTGAKKKSWSVNARVQFRTLVVTDEDPANGRTMDYRLSANYRPLPWLMLLGRVGLNQQFVAQPDESGVRLQDSLLAGLAFHSVSLEALGLDRKISFMHRLGVYLPTGYQSQLQDLYAAPEWLTQATIPIIPSLTFGVIGLGQYRFHKYAEQAGQQGGTLPRVVLAGLTFLEYSPLQSQTFGTLTLGADFYGYHNVDYPARSQDTFQRGGVPIPIRDEDLDGEVASDVYQSESFGYDVYLTYLPPVPYFALTVAWEQGAPLIRDGVTYFRAFNRDETTVSVTLTARY